VKNNIINLAYCPTATMIADFLTKPISKPKFDWCREQLGLSNLSRDFSLGVGAQPDTWPPASNVCIHSQPPRLFYVLNIFSTKASVSFLLIHAPSFIS
jgi:hypothetical protein